MKTRIIMPDGVSIESVEPLKLDKTDIIIYARVSDFVDSGFDHEIIYTRFKIILNYMKEHNMLNKEGLFVLNHKMDDSTVLHHQMFTKKGNDFIVAHIDQLLSIDNSHLIMYLNSISL